MVVAKFCVAGVCIQNGLFGFSAACGKVLGDKQSETEVAARVLKKDPKHTRD